VKLFPVVFHCLWISLIKGRRVACGKRILRWLLLPGDEAARDCGASNKTSHDLAHGELLIVGD
jgi:hypothetical protein